MGGWGDGFLLNHNRDLCTTVCDNGQQLIHLSYSEMNSMNILSIAMSVMKVTMKELKIVCT